MLGRFDRNKDLIDQNKLGNVDVVGCGGIGSALAVQMGIMGWKKVVFWDDDWLEEHNLSSTTYPADHLGNSKANAALCMLLDFGSKEQLDTSRANVSRIEPDIESSLTNSVFMCTDTMDSRRDVYEKWRTNNDREFFIDMMMGDLSLNVATATKENDIYMKTWYPDESVEDEPCTAKHTIFCAQLAAAMGMNQAFALLGDLPYYSYITYALSPPRLTVSQDDFVLPIISK